MERDPTEVAISSETKKMGQRQIYKGPFVMAVADEKTIYSSEDLNEIVNSAFAHGKIIKYSRRP